ncbi:TPA: hypothetical protein IU257_002305 [Enterococcus faecalis]|nr:hypothetical protein [Enterococcus faecalis]
MILVHGTSEESSSKIISSEKINPSKFNLANYLKALFELPSQEIRKELNDQHVMWLGEGIYAFEATDYKLAKTWRTRYGQPKISENDCAVIQINLDYPSVKNNIINFSTNEGKSILRKFMESDYDDLIQEMHKVDESRGLKLSYLKNLGYNIIKEKNVEAPYALGLFIEFMISSEFEDINSVKLIKATFSKQNRTNNYLETYVCIKDESVIQSMQVC